MKIFACNNFVTTAVYAEPVIRKQNFDSGKGAEIMNKTWKRFKVVLTAAGMAVCMTAGLGMGIYWSRDHVQKTAVAAAEKEMELEPKESEGVEIKSRFNQLASGDEGLYREMVLDAEIAKAVCDKYSLDYDTVKNKDITREMRNYEEALWMIKDMGDCPLFGYVEGIGAFGSLEMYLCEIYAFGGGEDVIRKMCAEFGIDPDKAVISDLTTEQLIKIGEEAYETSDHPKE